MQTFDQPSIQVTSDADFPIVVLHDGQGAQARIAPAAGLNVFAFEVQRGEETIPILIGPQNDEELRGGSFGFGCPILFPFPNRTRHGCYTFQGHEHQLDINWKDGHAIHGLVCNRPWHIVSTEADGDGGRLSARFQTDEHSDVMRQYPFSAELIVTYVLRDGVLGLRATVRNTGDVDLPMGFGIHPWFPAPLTAQGKRADCVLTVPARGRWELESEENLLPTGRVLPLDAGFDFHHGAPLAEHFLDDVFTDLIYQNDEHVCSLRDDASEMTLEVRASRDFREHVVYAPLDRDIVCLEPYTQTTDFVNLNARGVDAGLIVLAANQQWHGTIQIAPRFTGTTT